MSRRFRYAACLLLASLAITSTSDGAIIRLRRTAEIDSSLIRLGDIAEVYSDSAATDAELSELMIGPAPLAGTRIRLAASEIQSQLARRGVAAGELDIEGSAVVLVSRKPKPRSAPAPKVIHPGPATRPASPEPQTSPRPLKRRALISDLSAHDFHLAQTVVRNLVQQHLDRAAPDWGTPKIQSLLTTADAPQILKARKGNLQILTGQQLDEEHFLLTLAVPETEANVEQINVKVRIIRRPKVFAPVRPVAKGEVLREEDLIAVETDDVRNGIADPQELVGMEAAQSLRRGTAIRPTQVKSPLLVRRRETVQVISQSGQVRVRQFFVAKQDGRRGETILLEDLDGGRTIPATVTGRLEAQVVGTGTISSKGNPEQGAGLQLTVLNQ